MNLLGLFDLLCHFVEGSAHTLCSQTNKGRVFESVEVYIVGFRTCRHVQIIIIGVCRLVGTLMRKVLVLGVVLELLGTLLQFIIHADVVTVLVSGQVRLFSLAAHCELQIPLVPFSLSQIINRVHSLYSILIIISGV